MHANTISFDAKHLVRGACMVCTQNKHWSVQSEAPPAEVDVSTMYTRWRCFFASVGADTINPPHPKVDTTKLDKG